MPVLLPVLLVLLALLAGSVFAYGTEPFWATLGPWGFKFILFSCRFAWPLMLASLLLSAGLVVYVIAARRRAGWLIGLLPVLLLIHHRFTAGPAVGLSSIQDPPLVTAADAQTPDDELIVGTVVDSNPYAFSYAALHRTPVVVAGVGEKRLLLLWSALANRALAFTVARDLRAADLEIVSSPDNALLVYNTRLGEFINGVTGCTPRGDIPTGFDQAVPVLKTRWRTWWRLHPDTKLLPGSNAESFIVAQQPRYELPGNDPALKDSRRICVVAATQPIAVPTVMVTDHPLNLTSGQTSLLLVRIDGIAHAFSRNLPGDLVPRFFAATDTKHKTAIWRDSDTNSLWSASAAVVAEGSPQMHGLTMSPIVVEDDLYWNEMKFWYPDLRLASAAELAQGLVAQPAQPTEKPSGRHRKSVSH